jgi:hypothetical protein
MKFSVQVVARHALPLLGYFGGSLRAEARRRPKGVAAPRKRV